MSSRAPLGQGTNVDRYVVEALIGRGGMGEVYRATDDRLRRKVALKVLRAEDEGKDDGVARLFREARAAAALTHPNTVAIHDLGESDGLFYIVMELVSGKPLLAYVGDERVSVARRLKWLTEIARALATAHRAGVIHRDVKPSNVMVTDDDIAKVLDFGLAKPMPKPNEPESFGFKTQAGRVLGTVRYMSPEQMIGTDADARADQYALGLTAWELVAGKYPPGKPFEIPPLLDTLVPEFPKDGALTIARMMKRLPDDRFPSMDDVVAAFEDLAAGRPVRALELPTGTPRPARPEDHSVALTMEEPKVGSTLQSATPDDFSADTQQAIEEALQPTMTAAELAKLQASAPPPPTPEPAPAPEPAPKTPAVSTLMSPSANEAVQKAKALAMAHADSKPPSSSHAGKTVAMPSAPPPPATAKAAAAPSTLASADAGDKVAKVRAATSKVPVPVEIVDPPAALPKQDERADEGLPSTQAAPSEGTAPAKRSSLVYVLVALGLAFAAVAGWYFGQQSR